MAQDDGDFRNHEIHEIHESAFGVPRGDFRQQRYSCKFAQLGAMRNLAAQAFSQADEFALAPHRAQSAHMHGFQGRAVIMGGGMRQQTAPSRRDELLPAWRC